MNTAAPAPRDNPTKTYFTSDFHHSADQKQAYRFLLARIKIEHEKKKDWQDESATFEYSLKTPATDFGLVVRTLNSHFEEFNLSISAAPSGASTWSLTLAGSPDSVAAERAHVQVQAA